MTPTQHTHILTSTQHCFPGPGLVRCICHVQQSADQFIMPRHGTLPPVQPQLFPGLCELCLYRLRFEPEQTPQLFLHFPSVTILLLINVDCADSTVTEAVQGLRALSKFYVHTGIQADAPVYGVPNALLEGIRVALARGAGRFLQSSLPDAFPTQQLEQLALKC